jgi:hypothetical protein
VTVGCGGIDERQHHRDAAQLNDAIQGTDTALHPADAGGMEDSPAARADSAEASAETTSRWEAAVNSSDVTAPEPDATPSAVEASPDGSGLSTDASAESSSETVDSSPETTPGAQDAAGDGIPSPQADASPARDSEPPPTYTVVVMPDTQYYASSFPDVFDRQATWIVTQKTLLNITAVLHVGDLVDGDTSAQWGVASRAMRKLDAVNIPYVVVPGNHDYGTLDRKTDMSLYFGPTSMPWITGTMVAGRIENNYALLDIGPTQWLVLGIEFGPRDSVMAWADAVLSAYPDRPAIILTHAYLYRDGNRYDIAISNVSHQSFIPQDYGYTASEGINDGEMIWQKLVLPHANVRLVFSGHDTGFSRLASTRPDGSVVYQMLSDYQWYRIDEADYFGGGGYLRILKFDYGNQQISVRTYSPYLDQYLTDDQNEFVIGLESGP